MNIIEYFNTSIGSCLIVILIAVDYLRRYNTDNFQQKLLIVALAAIFTSAIFDFTGFALERIPGERVNTTLYYIWSIYLIARNCCYYFGLIFIDYFAHGNTARSKRFIKIVVVLMILYTITILLNLKYGFYFYVSRDNMYMGGNLYILQIFFSYLPILLALIDITLAPKHIKRTQILLIIFFIILTALGAALDIILRSTNLIWPCITGAVLYIYFFIIRSASKIDSLTGIGNRNYFYDYINTLSNQSTKQDYAFIKIDLKRLGEINSIFGHLVGDKALRDITAIIKGCIRYTDIAVRYGGDEFIIITTAENDIKRIIDRINNSIADQNKNNIRPYKLTINYSYNIYITNSGWEIQDFLTQLNSKMIKRK
ncbi:MAG: GGDEF domain-containing protein [Treponema sp.]|nr:GGDEF domain-containing protein [Treponema sp.]